MSVSPVPPAINIMKSDYFDFNKTEYERLKDISVSHLYRLRATNRYKFRAKTFTGTNSTKVNIGERRKPYPEGKPGYLCVDSVHQGDENGEKGAYHINLVDMVTQAEFGVCGEDLGKVYGENIKGIIG